MADEKHVRVPLTDLDSERLDTGFYSPDYFTARSQLRDSGLSVQAIGSFGEPWSFGAYALTSEIEWTRPGEGVPFFKAESLDSPLVDEGGLSFVTDATHRKLPKSSVGPGDIVVSTSGTVGRVAVVPTSMPRANSNQDTIKFNPRRSDIDNYFLAAQLCSRFGQVFLNREAGGAVQQHVYLYNFKRIPLAIPHTDAQRYIGSKVRQAEALREWARVRVDAILSDYDAVARRLPVSGRRHARVTALMLRDRLDSEHYPDEVLQAFSGASVADAVRLADVTTDIFSGSTLPADEGAGAVRQATVATLDRVFLNDRFRSVQAPRGVGRPFSTHDLSIAAAAHTASYIGKDVTYVVVDGLAYPSTEVLTVRPDRDRVPASWLWCFLKSSLGYRQVQACVRGISAHAYPDDIREVIVPMPTEDLRARFNDRDGVMVRANHASVAARLLATAARLLVEALIERKVSEAELIEAGKDADADCALLSRLAEDGLDGSGAPLFSDLDGLADLILEAAR